MCMITCCGLCMDVDFLREGYSRHRYRIVVMTEDGEKLSLRFENDRETEIWFETIKRSMARRPADDASTKRELDGERTGRDRDAIVVRVDAEASTPTTEREKLLNELIASEEAYVRSITTACEVCQSTRAVASDRTAAAARCGDWRGGRWSSAAP